MNNLRANDFKMFQNGIFFFAVLCKNKQANKQTTSRIFSCAHYSAVFTFTSLKGVHKCAKQGRLKSGARKRKKKMLKKKIALVQQTVITNTVRMHDV